MKLAIAFSLAVALTLGVGRGADKTNSPTDAKTVLSNAEQMKALRKEVDDAEAVYLKAFEDRKPEDQVDRLWSTYCKLDNTNLPKIFELARQEPSSETAFQMFGWIVTNRRIFAPWLYTNGLQSVGFLRDYHTTNPKLARICRFFGIRWDPNFRPALDFLQTAADRIPTAKFADRPRLRWRVSRKKMPNLYSLIAMHLQALRSSKNTELHIWKERNTKIQKLLCEKLKTYCTSSSINMPTVRLLTPPTRGGSKPPWVRWRKLNFMNWITWRSAKWLPKLRGKELMAKSSN